MLAIRRAVLQQSSLLLPGARVVPSVKSNYAMAQIAQGQLRGMANTKDDGQFKTWKPLAPTLRQRRMTSRKHLHKGGPIRDLTVARRRSGGRNNTGRITCRHRGGGAKRRIRLVDFKRSEPGPQQVVRLEYDPGRTAHIALLKHMESGKLSYILAPVGLKPGAVVQSYMGVDLGKLQKPQRGTNEALSEAANSKSAAEEPVEDAMQGANTATRSNSHDMVGKVNVEVGNCMPLRLVPIGTTVHNIGLYPYGRAQLARSAGASAQVLFTSSSGQAHIKLMSGEIRRVPVDACATIGQVSNTNHKHEKLGSAGSRRRRGWRPTVRGTAMNTHDHPHGGGRGKSKGNKDPRSPWGKLAKGGKTRTKTNPMVIRGRPRR
ncbi:mitochondrial 54S ribosomal protein rml2 [Coemansia spiralis]|uniref:Large ribosomal subunit protein uL2m n=2 Tax=Coemansia TaxID=4863 RepID=A0A9W8G7P6_9FUNG|nr:translation protein SH3-like domain-containing protein [Coemansia spiralis]KAJ1990967.1 mitochondrial 54S ribosomal protein rml2 [Coemansia umbellata]KAJ2620977.1 mitochondrial 54S ribosomal protein rml2 [Coemansia sp. RSA 1358]KAJ2675726.1 mitochondrial 54S ribosomal protein rml2 [Coemansia spiralis]